MKRKIAYVVALVGTGLVAPLAMAGPPSMDAIVFPVDLASIGTVIAAAGATVLLIVFGYRVAFSLVRRLASKMQKAI